MRSTVPLSSGSRRWSGLGRRCRWLSSVGTQRLCKATQQGCLLLQHLGGRHGAAYLFENPAGCTQLPVGFSTTQVTADGIRVHAHRLIAIRQSTLRLVIATQRFRPAQICLLRIRRESNGGSVIRNGFLNIALLLEEASPQRKHFRIRRVANRRFVRVGQCRGSLPRRRVRGRARQVGTGIIRLQGQRLPEIGRCAGVVSELVIAQAAMQERGVILAIERDGLTVGFNGLPVQFLSLQTLPLPVRFLSPLEGRRRPSIASNRRCR